jgi:predicted dithiol-disulfide oxidoreductase (DUF899 family)
MVTVALLSAADNTFKRDFNSQTPDGQQTPMLNVFQRDNNRIRHFWSSEMWYAPSDPGQDPRHTGTIEPLFNLLDLTPEGRSPTWKEQLTGDATDVRHHRRRGATPSRL